MIDYTSTFQDMSIPVLDRQGDLVIAAIVVAVVFASYVRFRLWRRAR